MIDSRIQEIRTLLPRAMLGDWVRLGSRLVRLLRDNRHAHVHDAVLSRLLDQARKSVQLRETRQVSVPEITYPADLPITERREDILQAIRNHQVVVISGETGSGKTTQIPKMCLEAGLGIEAKIGCTQPRRVAALSISQRVAEELNTNWGSAVGCKIRFDERASAQTYIKFMTDGILLAETQGDPLLSEYNALILDEAHERSLNIDFLLGYLKGLLGKRPELKLIITSATIETATFSKAFNDAPVIEVSGRLYPVEIHYSTAGDSEEEESELDYIDAAVSTTESICQSSGAGDVLIFMPGERDIRETSEQLRTVLQQEAEIIPLYGRLSGGEQNRVFLPAQRRKIVVATNIAETSLTIPGIRYVIDSGLARISRYNPRTRTKRLPIEAIAQSSANQRTGRAGRVQAGVCIRLYSQADFASRPPFAQPEIQRANLAEVILRMKAFRLGDIETFPFLNPPTPAAINAGYSLLQELGALDEARNLTELGQRLARLPIDPTLGRMLLESQHEHATCELLIIAAGLSIQDPRERPLDQRDAADAVHKQFNDPRSDFLALLNIWTAVHDEWEALKTQGQRRRFCKARFLSYLRMREWQDLHAQLHDALEELGTVRLNESSAAYEAIHKSILAGLLGHVAERTERNQYKGVSGKTVNIFPGSVLFEKGERRPSNKRAPRQAPRPVASNQPQWIVSGELVETSQLFARTLAGIEPSWIIELAPHLCRTTHHNPRWDAKAGKVLVTEITNFYGLELRNRQVAYSNINPVEATEIFIRSALLEGALFPEPVEIEEGRKFLPSQSQLLAQARAQKSKLPLRYNFIEFNRRVRQKIEMLQTRVRRHDLPNLDDALFSFYAKRLGNVSSIEELNRFLGEHLAPKYLQISEEDLLPAADLDYDTNEFPDSLNVDGRHVAVSYAYNPGEDNDGVTLQLTPALALDIPAAKIEWAIPGLRAEQVAELIRGLPKAIRRQLMPFQPKVAEISQRLHPGTGSLAENLSKFVAANYGVEVPVSAWNLTALPGHLRPRIEVVAGNTSVLAASRDLESVRNQLTQAAVAEPFDDPAWALATRKWEKFGLTTWSCGDLPERITIADGQQGAVYAWPGLELEEGHVNLRLFRSQTDAFQAGTKGLQRLLELSLQKELAWLQKDLRAVVQFEPKLAGLCTVEQLQSSAFEHLKAHLLPHEPLQPLTEEHFKTLLEQIRQKIPGLATELMDRIRPILELRLDLLKRYRAAKTTPGPLKGLDQLGTKAPAVNPITSLVEGELKSLLPQNFLEVIPFAQLPHIARYLKALSTRAERASLNPVKDRERAQLLKPYTEAWQQLAAAKRSDPQVQQFRWMLDEFKVSLFAQELGTAYPISAKRLDEQLRKIRAYPG